MIKSSLTSLAKSLYQALPETIKPWEKDIEQHCHALFSATLNKLHLVTREEFDVQQKVLARTREKVEALEAQVQTLLDALNKTP